MTFFNTNSPKHETQRVRQHNHEQRATQRSPNQAKRFFSPLPIKTHAVRDISCKFLTDGAVTSCYRASPLRWGCAAEMMPRGCLSPHATETSCRRRRRLSSVWVLMSCSSPGDPARQLTPCETHSAPLHVYRGTEHREESSLSLNTCLWRPEGFTGDLGFLGRSGSLAY